MPSFTDSIILDMPIEDAERVAQALRRSSYGADFTGDRKNLQQLAAYVELVIAQARYQVKESVRVPSPERADDAGGGPGFPSLGSGPLPCGSGGTG